MQRNYIGGEWVEGTSAVENIIPSDTRDIIGLYARASRAQAQAAIAVVAAMVEKLAVLKVGDARKSGTMIGPVVDQAQLEQDCRYIAIGHEEGARLAFGGQQLPSVDGQPGFYFQPTLFTETDNRMRINREEIFAWTLMCPLAGARVRATGRVSRAGMRRSSTPR